MPKSILYVVSHSRIHEDRYHNVMNTWGQDVECVFYSDHEDLSRNIIKTSESTEYGSGEEKLTTMMNILPDKYLNYDWYIHCDNDTFINTKKMSQLAEIADPNKLHGLVATIEFPRGVILHYCGGGASYLMSNSVYHNIYRGKSRIYNSGYGDVAIGVLGREKNLGLQHHNGFHSFPPHHYNYIDNKFIANQYTFHYIKDFELMNRLYENSKSYTQF